MPDENGTETTRSDAPSVEEQDSSGEIEQDGQADDNDAEDKAHAVETGGPEDLKVVVSLKGGRATIGVQQPSSDPHIETFDASDLSGLTQEVSAVVDRARARWEDSPKNPAYQRPAPPARGRNRRGQGAAQDANGETETEQAQQQTLKLF